MTTTIEEEIAVHGNFGSVDGDPAAAMRYTEVRMGKIAEEMLEDIEKDTVDFVPNYDESLKEPTVLPSKVPALLINGSAGIAVGMATNIPPHNLGEVVDGLVMLIDNPEVEIADLMTAIKGPDFPTGAIILGNVGIQSAYTTGRGVIKVRAQATIEPMSLEGCKVQAVLEICPFSNGLTRNIVQCLQDYNIPLHLSHTITKIHGKDRLTGITVAKVDDKMQPIAGTEFEIECDTLLLSVGLIPENELSLGMHLEMHPLTSGPIVNQRRTTSLPGVYAAGNVVHGC